MKKLLFHTSAAALAVVLAIGVNAAFADVNPTDVPANTGHISPTFNGVTVQGNASVAGDVRLGRDEIVLKDDVGINAGMRVVEIAPYMKALGGIFANTISVGPNLQQSLNIGPSSIATAAGWRLDINTNGSVRMSNVETTGNLNVSGTTTLNNLIVPAGRNVDLPFVTNTTTITENTIGNKVLPMASCPVNTQAISCSLNFTNGHHRYVKGSGTTITPGACIGMYYQDTASWVTSRLTATCL